MKPIKILSLLFLVAIVMAGIANAIITSDHRSDNSFDAYLEDNTMVEILLISSERYSPEDWFRIKQLTFREIKNSNNLVELEKQIPEKLSEKNYDIVGVTIYRAHRFNN